MAFDLRKPSPSPDRDGFVGREPELLSVLGGVPTGPDGRASHTSVHVLHGPPGVGKSALAAEAARRLGHEQRRRSGADPVPVHWLCLGDDTVDVPGTLLRLLAECGAPQVPVVRAAHQSGRAFGRLLREQCAQHFRERIVVLDDIGPAAHPLLKVLRGCLRLR